MSSCGDNLSKKQIISLVVENEAFLTECVNNGGADQALELYGVQSVDTARDGAYIVFDCGGSGFGSSTNYCGFYYSPDDIPQLAGHMTSEDSLTTDGSGYGYRQPDGDNRYYTERIVNNWFYFEAHY